MPRNRLPFVRTVGISHECGVNCQAPENVRVPADGVMRQGTRGFRQNYAKSNKCERLPKFGNFVPDEESSEGCARCGEEAPQSSLLGIVAMRGEPGSEIKHGAENWQSQQAYANVGVLRGYEMQVDGDGPEKREEGEKRI